MSSKFARSVSIIGVGMTKFGDSDDTPELKNMSLQDMGAWACLEAMEDAGVNPRQIDKLIVGEVCAVNGNSQSIAPNHGMLEWVGMRGKASVHQSEACATPFDCFNEAVLSVASGRYDIVMCVDMDSARHITHPDKPSCYTYPSSMYKEFYGKEWPGGNTCQNTAWDRWSGGVYSSWDSIARRYIKEAGITPEDFDDAMNGQSVTARHHGVMNPKAYVRTPWEDTAKMRKFDDVNAYLKSRYNPPLSEYQRPSTFMMLSEGAAAIIVCASEIADQFRHKPIEVVDLAQYDLSVMSASATPEMNIGAAKQLFERSEYKPEDVEYFQTTDGDLTDALYSAEAFGYLPKGEGWKYFRDGETAYNGKKPMNTDGGHQCLGHAFGATGMATIGECVFQMRGEAGERQIPNVPKLSLMRGWGAGQSVTAYLFKTLEGVEPKGKEIGHYDPKPVTRMFYDGLDQGKFLGMRCSKCGAVEFPPHPACSACGSIDNELVELSGDVTIKEIYKVSPVFTTPEFAMYAPLFGGEVQLKEGPAVNALIFGITDENYAELRDSVPLQGKLVVLPKNGYNTFAVSYNNVMPVAAEDSEESDAYEKLLHGHLIDKEDENTGIRYALHVKAMGAVRDGELVLNIKDGALSGTVTAMDMTKPIQEPQLDGENFQFFMKGRGMKLVFSGQFEDDRKKVSGTIKGPINMEFWGEQA